LKKVTVPVAVDGVTVAVSVTDCANWEGFTDDPRPVVETACTTWVRMPDALVASSMSLPYAAVMLWLPTLRALVASVAVPELNVPVPMLVTPA
jgi:hypothetical protein